MNFGKMLGFASPLAGMLTGNGAGLLPFLSPGFGMISGKGPFSHLLGGGHHNEQASPMMGSANAAMDAAAPQASPAPTGMFGSSAQIDPQMLMRYRQMMGGY